jgi:hypothetical protein
MFECERRRKRIRAKKAFAAPEHDGVGQKAKVIDKTGGEQLAHDLAAAEGDEIRTGFLFEGANGIGEITGKHAAGLPVECVGVMRDDVFGRVVKNIRDLPTRRISRDLRSI